MRVRYYRNGKEADNPLLLDTERTTLELEFETEAEDERRPVASLLLQSSSGKITPISAKEGGGGSTWIEGRMLPRLVWPVVIFSSGEQRRVGPELRIIPLGARRLALLLALTGLFQLLLGVWLLNSVDWDEAWVRLATGASSLGVLALPVYVAFGRLVLPGRGGMADRVVSDFRWPLTANGVLLAGLLLVRFQLVRVDNQTERIVRYGKPVQKDLKQGEEVWLKN